MAALVRTFRVKGFNDPKTPVGVVTFQYQEEGLLVRMFRPDGNWMPAFAYLIGQPREEFYRGSGLDQTFFVTVQKEDSTRVGHILEYTTSVGTQIVDLELVDAIDAEWPVSEAPLVPQGEDPDLPNTLIPRRQFHPVELSVTVGGLEPEGPATFYSQDPKGFPDARNYTVFKEGRYDHFHEPHESLVWVRAFKGGKDFVGNIVLPAGSSRVSLDFDPETGDMTADVVLFPPSQSPLQEFGGPIRRVAPGFKPPVVYTLEVQITKEGERTPALTKMATMYTDENSTTPAAYFNPVDGFSSEQTFSQAVAQEWFFNAIDLDPPRAGILRWPTISGSQILRFDLTTGGDGPTGGDEGTVTTWVSVTGQPASRDVVIVEQDANGDWRVVGFDKTNAQGEAVVAVKVLPDTKVYSMAADDYGIKFVPNLTVEEGQRVRPPVYRGWVYQVTESGTLPNTEPEWWPALGDNVPRLVGTARLQAVRYYQPIAHGPVPVTLV